VPTSDADFRWLACAVRYRARASFALPPQAAVALRGALGFLLPPEIFRPTRETGPSGLRTAPPPFVLRTAALNRRAIESGEEFGFALNLFAPALLPIFVEALARLAGTGLGPRRAKLEWLGVTAVDECRDLRAAEPCARLRVDFLTPTELKGWETEAVPPFALLLRRVRDRVSALRLLYGGGAPELDFRGLAIRAASVETREGRLVRIDATRRSSRTLQVHPLSGFTGHAVYSGELSEFVPLLRLAEHTGVGRQTVWGHGETQVTLLPDQPDQAPAVAPA
jgi:hypothetical protein